jgi:hypothetical protein
MHASSLVRRQNREAAAGIDQGSEGVVVARRFPAARALRASGRNDDEVGDAPQHLGSAIARVA